MNFMMGVHARCSTYLSAIVSEKSLSVLVPFFPLGYMWLENTKEI